MFEGYEELNTQDVERMQEVIRTLLAQTFLPERKYDKKYGRMMPDRMYDFSDRHLEFLTEYFAVAGIKLRQDTELGIIYLEGADGIGEKLPKLATIYLLLLKLIYDENGGCFFQCQCNNDIWRIKWKSGRIPSHQGTVIDDGDQKSVCHSEKISDGRVFGCV